MFFCFLFYCELQLFAELFHRADCSRTRQSSEVANVLTAAAPPHVCPISVVLGQFLR